MKYAFMSFSCPESSFGEMLAMAQRYGYDALEPRAGSSHKHGVELDTTTEERAQIKAQAAEAGIALSCLATSCRYADPATVEAQVAETRQYIDLAADIGAPTLRVFGGKIPAGVTREAAIQQVAQALGDVSAQAAERGVTICLETHDDWCAPADVVTVMAQVNQPTIGVNWDIMHPVRAGGATMDEAYSALKPWIRYVHIHDGTAEQDKLTFLPIGQGVYDHKRALELLSAGGYTGYLSGEWLGWEPPEIHLPRELAAMKQYEAEISTN